MPPVRQRPALVSSALAVLASVAILPGSAVAATEHRVMILGDSISQGAAGDTTWRARLWQSLAASPAAGTVDFVGTRRGLFNYVAGTQDGGTAYADPAFDQDHEALWGLRLSAATSTIASTLTGTPTRPDVLVVELGTNDVAAGAAQAATNLRTLVQRARQTVPGIDVLLVEPYSTWDPKYQTWPNRDFVQALGGSIRSLAAELNTAAARVVAVPVADFDARAHAWDGRHPNATGELLIAAAVARGLSTIGIGDGPHLPATATWAATGPQPTVTLNPQRTITATWPDSTAGALDYAVEQRHRSATGAVLQDWTRVALTVRTNRTWTSPVLVVGDRYDLRIVPVRRTMSGTPGPATTITVPSVAASTPAPTPTAPRPRPWWQWW